jgi:hypothetical protein
MPPKKYPSLPISLLFRKMFCIAELTAEVMNMLTFSELVIFSRCCTAARVIVCGRILQRFKTLVGRVTSNSIVPILLRAMIAANTVVVGSVASLTLAHSWRVTFAKPPKDVNIITPYGTMDRWIGFKDAVAQLYTVTEDSASFSVRHSDTVRRVKVFNIWELDETRPVSISDSGCANGRAKATIADCNRV